MSHTLIRVMSFNIRYGLADDGENHWRHRKSLALARVRAFDPDLLGLQECRDDEQAEFIRDHLPDYRFLGIHREGPGETALEMAPLLFRESAFQLQSTGHFWLSETPEIAGSKSWGSAYPRTVTWARLLHIPSQRTLVYANTHLDYEPAAIAGGARLLHQWLGPLVTSIPAIVTGDFNADKGSDAYRLLTKGSKLIDTHRLAHPTPRDEPTYHGYGRPEEMAPLDWILVSHHFRVQDARIDRYQEGSLYPSDHYPITALLDWPP